MPYREVTMLEVKEVLRLWCAGTPKKKIAKQIKLDPKTVRRYVAAAQKCGLRLGATVEESHVAAVVAEVHTPTGRPHGDGWDVCGQKRDFIAQHLKHGVRLSKVRKLLARQGVQVTYATLHRYATAELGFGRTAATIPIADCGPGEEVQLDTGWMTMLEPNLFGERRRFRAWIFTAVLSRHRFVWPCFRETTETAIEACEEAWQFFGGIFKAVIVDNTKTIIDDADPLGARINATFLEYAQARGFHIDATRARSPKDKARVERSVPTVRDDCFGGERLHTIEEARTHARTWCETEYGMRRHTRTQRLPREHFEAEEKSALLRAPTEAYDTPLWCEPKVARDQHAQVAKALYSLPTRFVGKTLRARADRNLVRFYDGATLVKTHPRLAPGKRATDTSDFPEHKTAYAMRDIAYLQREAAKHGESVGRYAAALLDAPLPWTRMRRVYALLGLCKRYGGERVDETCRTALGADMVDIHRLTTMLKLAAPPPAEPPRNVVPLGRYMRPASQYALPLFAKRPNEGEKS